VYNIDKLHLTRHKLFRRRAYL